MTRREQEQQRCSDFEKGVAIIIGGMAGAMVAIGWGLPALVDLIIYMGA